MLEDSATPAPDAGLRAPTWRTRLADGAIRSRERALNHLSRAAVTPALNEDLPAPARALPPDLAARLRDTLVELKGTFIDDTGAYVDYKALRSSAAYRAYRTMLVAALHPFQPDLLAEGNARRAFWINLYNTLVLDAVITYDIEESVIEGRLGLLAFFRHAAYRIGGRRTSLEDIEHGILRANRGNPFVPGRHLPSSDPALAWVVPLDPRIHFALNCGGRSCPPIRYYTADQLDAQLDLASRSFVAATTTLEAEQQRLRVSPLFQWYRRDFGGRGGVIDFLIRTLPDDARRRSLVEQGAQARIGYAAYDWRLNGV